MAQRKNTILLALQSGVEKLSALVLTVLLSRFLTVEAFGYYQQSVLVTKMLIPVAALGIPVGLSYFHGRYPSYSDRVRMYQSFFLTMVAAAGGLSLLFWLTTPALAVSFRNDYFADYGPMLAGLLFFSALNTFFRNFYLLIRRMRRLTMANFVVLVGGLGANVAVLLLYPTPEMLIGTLLGVQVVLFFALYGPLHRFMLVRPAKRFLSRAELVATLPLMVTPMVGLINSQVDQVMVALMVDIEEYAMYRVGSTRIPFITIVTGSVVTALLPLFSGYYREGRLEDIVKVWRESTEQVTYVLLPVFVFCVVFGQEIIVLLFSEKYAAGGLVFQVYTLRFLMAVVVFGPVMTAIDLQYKWLGNVLIGLAVNVAINPFAIWYFGAVGAAYVTLLVFVLSVWLQIAQIRSKVGFRFRDYFPVRTYLIVFGISLLYALLFYFLLGGLLSYGKPLLLVLAGGFYALTLVTEQRLLFPGTSLKSLLKRILKKKKQRP